MPCAKVDILDFTFCIGINVEKCARTHTHSHKHAPTHARTTTTTTVTSSNTSSHPVLFIID